jgi:hypothetical protein
VYGLTWLFRPVLKAIRNLERIITMNQAELQASLEALTAQNEKAHQEHLDALAALEEALAAAGGTTPEVDAALEALKASIQKDDDLSPDA